MRRLTRLSRRTSLVIFVACGWTFAQPLSEASESGQIEMLRAEIQAVQQETERDIESLRQEFSAPRAPFVLATIAFGGETLDGPGLTVLEAQLAVSGETGKYPQFAGNVKAVDARPFWRDARNADCRRRSEIDRSLRWWCW